MDKEITPTEGSIEVIFENRNRARMVFPSLDVKAKEILKTLELEQPEALILIAGTRGEIEEDLNLRLQ